MWSTFYIRSPTHLFLCTAAPAPAPATKTFPALAGTNPSTAVSPTAPNLAGTTAVPPANQGIVAAKAPITSAAKAPTTSASGRRSLA